jgi:hypothetical protein
MSCLVPFELILGMHTWLEPDHPHVPLLAGDRALIKQHRGFATGTSGANHNHQFWYACTLLLSCCMCLLCAFSGHLHRFGLCKPPGTTMHVVILFRIA